ncbi:MAG: flavin reductase family protein [Candidatus Dormibacteraeota bacterium]|nr:flavin reductase family protein [Candidatus Dormibacteraeota bacterium]
MPPSPDELREALSRHAAAVSVVASADGGVYRGLTATSLVTVSLDPPTLLVSLDALTSTAETVGSSGGYSVSLLAREQEFLAERFAGTAPPAPPRWDGIPHTLTSGGRPVLRGALAWLDCAVEERYEVADHLLFVGRVLEVASGSGNPLIWWGRQAWTIS